MSSFLSDARNANARSTIGNKAVLPRVFISYSHESAVHNDHVLNLSDHLRRDGIDCVIDQYIVSPSEGWAKWMERQIRNAHFILVVCTDTYLRRIEGREQVDVGHGAQWESTLVYQHIYDTAARNDRFIPLLLDSHQKGSIPIPLRGATYYAMDARDGYINLYRRLTNQPHVTMPALGSIRPLPARVRQSYVGPVGPEGLGDDVNVVEPPGGARGIPFTVPAAPRRASLSRKTLNEFREYLVYAYVLRTIQDEFESADISLSHGYDPQVSGERRTLIEKYYHSLDLQNDEDAGKLLLVFENILVGIESEARVNILTRWLERDGFTYENGGIRPR